MTAKFDAAELSPLGLAALEYAARGWPVFPLHTPRENRSCSCLQPSCGNAGKHPRTRQGFKDATTDATQIRTWWSDWPDANIGVVTGRDSGLVVLDLDPRNGSEQTFDDLVSDVGPIPEDVHALTGGGGKHLLFAYPRDTAAFKPRSPGPGIDVKSDGGYIVAPPSLHASGRRYTWEASSDPSENELPAIPPALLARLGLRLASAPTQSAPAQLGVSAADTVLGRLFGLAGFVVRPLSGGKLAVRCPWDHEHTTGSPGDSSTVLFPPIEDAQLGGFLCSHGHCAKRTFREVLDAFPREAVLAAKASLGYAPPPAKPHNMGAPQAPPVPPGAAVSDEAAERAAQPQQQAQPGTPAQNARAAQQLAPWGAVITRDLRGDVVPSPANVALVLQLHPDWQCLAWDVFSDRLCYRSPPPYHEAFAHVAKDLRNARAYVRTPDPSSESPVEEPFRVAYWEDHHAVAVADWFAREIGLKISIDNARAGVDMAARSRAFHPVREYLHGLVWDGVERAETWLQRFLGVEDSPYVRDVGRAFLVGGVARVMWPGCKLDTLLVLEGSQGAGKSTVIQALFGRDCVNDTSIDLHSKDRFGALAGKWAIEHAELDGLSKADAERVKAFSSSSVDRYRPAYGRTEIVQPRQCVFVGTTNADRYLRDETGGRRFLGVRVTRIDLEGVIRERDQLWAEAVALFGAGAKWWPDSELAAQYRDEQEDRRIADAWEDVLARWLADKNETSLDAALEQVGLEKGRWTMPDQLRVTKCLRALGWKQGRSTGPGRARGWRRG